MQSDQPKDIVAFLDALRKDEERKLAEKKAEIEDRIAELIGMKRRETEGKIRIISKAQNHKREALKRESALKLRGEVQHELDLLQRRLMEKFKGDLIEKIETMRENEEKYTQVLSLLEKEMSSFSDLYDDFEIKPSEGLGGCVGESSGGGVAIDNTFETRLERVLPEVSRKLAFRFNEVLEKHPDVWRQLRIS